MITPLDLENKRFSKKMMNGYNVEEVDNFLDELTEQFTRQYKENNELNPFPLCARQRALAHGILPDKELRQVGGLHPAEGLRREVGLDGQGFQAIDLLYIPADIRQQPPGNGGFAAQLQADAPLRGIKLRAQDHGVRQPLRRLVSGLIEGKHIQKEYIVLHNQLP